MSNIQQDIQNFTALQTLITQDVNNQDNLRYSLLHYSAEVGNKEIAGILPDSGADVEAIDRHSIAEMIKQKAKRRVGSGGANELCHIGTIFCCIAPFSLLETLGQRLKSIGANQLSMAYFRVNPEGSIELGVPHNRDRKHWGFAATSSPPVPRYCRRPSRLDIKRQPSGEAAAGKSLTIDRLILDCRWALLCTWAERVTTISTLL
ncbi:hypothetical protein BX600DRAFT_525409 [Xylariales sp. PMI_506]|nr:hypothetical protein BX600DRAFT_525409 [Xylariales sp. PMI_506]